MTDYRIYTTQNGDRWDTIAYREYGDCYKYQPIIEANPHLPLMTNFTSGIEVLVPVLNKENSIQTNNLPIWKRKQNDLR